MIAHDGIVGSSELGPVAAPAEAFDPPQLLKALGRGPRAGVIDFELIEPLTIRTEPDDLRTAKADGSNWAASVCLQDTGDTLVRIARPSTEQFERQLAHVRGYAELRPDRVAEIHLQIADIQSFFGAVDLLDPNRTPWTLELLDAGVRLAIMVEMRIKHALNVPRPVTLSPRIQPIIQTPAHGSFPSGHATESAIVATLLSHLGAAGNAACAGKTVGQADFIGLSAQLASQPHQRYRVAARIAANRTVAGVHYPVDSAAGAVLGTGLGEYIVAMATDQGCTTSRDFEGGQYAPDAGAGGDFHARALGQILTSGRTDLTGTVVEEHNPISLKVDRKHLKALWALALEEVTAQWPREAGNA